MASYAVPPKPCGVPPHIPTRSNSTGANGMGISSTSLKTTAQVATHYQKNIQHA